MDEVIRCMQRTVVLRYPGILILDEATLLLDNESEAFIKQALARRKQWRIGGSLMSEIDPVQPTIYQIRIKGHLGRHWTDWFEGLTITLEEEGDTLLTGPVVDQAALHGLLKKVRDLGMPLVSVNRVDPRKVDASNVKE